MKTAVVCANGKAGKLIVKEEVERGLDVTAIVRGENQSAAQKVIRKDLFDLTAEDLEQFDVVVDAFGAWTKETIPQHCTSLKHLCDILSGKETRLLVVGGEESLYLNPEHTSYLMDGADFPEAFKPLAASQAKSLEELREKLDIIKLETRGSMVSFVARGAEEEIAAVVNGRSTIFFETLPLSLEEVFISEMEAAGYDLDRILS